MSEKEGTLTHADNTATCPSKNRTTMFPLLECVPFTISSEIVRTLNLNAHARPPAYNCIAMLTHVISEQSTEYRIVKHKIINIYIYIYSVCVSECRMAEKITSTARLG